MKRELGCVNKNCSKYRERIHYKSDVTFCTECGSELVSVCKMCHRKIDKSDALLCDFCKVERTNSRNRIAAVGMGAASLVAGSVKMVPAAVAFGIGAVVLTVSSVKVAKHHVFTNID